MSQLLCLVRPRSHRGEEKALKDASERNESELLSTVRDALGIDKEGGTEAGTL
jgi:hypothetical protein